MTLSASNNSDANPLQELVPEFRPVMYAYYDALTALGMRLMRLLALTLNLPPGFFTDRFQQPLASLRPIHYSGRISQPDDVRVLLRHPASPPADLGRQTARIW